MSTPPLIAVREGRLKAAFRAELFRALEGTGLEVHFDAGAPWISFPGQDNAGFWAHLGLQRWPGHPEHGRASLVVRWVTGEDPAGTESCPCLDLRMITDDAALLASLAVAAVKADTARRIKLEEAL